MCARLSFITTIVLSATLSETKIYFDIKSHITLAPNTLTDHASFGFSMGFQNGANKSLITGAPQSNLIGKVFKCPIDNVLASKTETCPDVNIDFDTLAPYKRTFAPTLKFNLGATIAATPDFFLTCAPLWTTIPKETSKDFSYGTCFVYDESAHRYQGMLERYNAKPSEFSPSQIDRFYGGTGWTTLADVDNDLLIIAKLALKADIISLNCSAPLAPVNSFVSKSRDQSRDENWNYLKRYRNVGYAMTNGEFFNNKTVYAISATSDTVEGTVHFVRSKWSTREKILKLHFLTDSKHKKVKIVEKTIGSMFGASMCSADLNLDGLSELIVGAPAQDDTEGGFETGAVHIYLGGDMKTIGEENRHRVILGAEDGSRFGFTLAATDIDGDKYPEIFISAPYEDFGVGALYILSGYEIYQEFMKIGEYKLISIYQFKLTQKIYNTRFKTFGYSLQTISDLDGNGCDELAVGSPGMNSVMLLRCIPSVNVTVTAELMGSQIVKEQDKEFVVNVCVNVKHLKDKNFSVDVTVNNEVIGNGAVIGAGQMEYVMSFPDKAAANCHPIKVTLSDNEPGEYSFTTKVEMDETSILNNANFNPLWVTLSPQSVVEASIEVSRHCTGHDCEPNLDMAIGWSGSTDFYNLGSLESIDVTLNIENKGNSSYDGCVWVLISGAPVAQFGCVNENDGYRCYMPKPLKRSDNHKLEIKFNMKHPNNLHKQLLVQAHLYDYCKKPESKKEYKFTLPYIISTESVHLKGTSHNQTVTDITIQDKETPVINDAQEYLVINEGPVTWKAIKAIVAIDSKPFINDSRVSSTFGCEANKEKTLFTCIFDLLPNSTTQFIVSSDISKEFLLDRFLDGKLIASSRFTLEMTPTTDIKQASLTTVFTLQKELSLGQNKAVIITLAILGAIIALAIVIFILYRMEFFKRKGKTRLELLKQDHQRRQSVKYSMSSSQGKDLDCDLDIEVEDDNAFEIVDMNEPALESEEKKEKKSKRNSNI